MQKELHKTLSSVIMYSKMGRYISNKILKYNKSNHSPRHHHKNSPAKQDYLPLRKSPNSTGFRISCHQTKSNLHQTQPPVGSYKLNRSQIDRNVRTYNFNRSVPHFYREKFSCNENSPVVKDYPDVSTSKSCVKGLVELKRIISRDARKGCVRSQIEDPHEQRFEKIQTNKQNHSPVNINKTLSRNDFMLHNKQLFPEHNIVKDSNPYRLDTHIIPFGKMIPRDGQALLMKKGISDYFDRAENTQECKSKDWKKYLARQTGGVLPSYMQKSINTRTSVGLLNLKTLEMNCTDMKKRKTKANKQEKKSILYVEEDGNNKTMVSAAFFEP